MFAIRERKVLKTQTPLYDTGSMVCGAVFKVMVYEKKIKKIKLRLVVDCQMKLSILFIKIAIAKSGIQ